jgi:hypothetical protein
MKVKIEGRRRLCKVSTRHNDSSDDTVVLDDPTFSDITEFDSPPPKNAGERGGENMGGNEIRDILSDLSAKFDFLSIEKKRVPKRIELVEDSLDLVREKEMSGEKEVDFPEYASAGSLLSLASDMSGSSLGLVNSAGGGVENAVEEHEKKSDLWNVYEGNRAHGVKNTSGKLNRNEPREVDEKLMSRRQPFETETEEEKVFGFKDDGFVGGVQGTKKHGGAKTNDPLPRRMNKKLVPVQKLFESKVEEREDDCVILSGKKMVKVVEKWGVKLKDEYNDSYGDDVLDDYADGSVLEDDGSISFSGPKSSYKLPGKIAKMLYPHQRDGLRWLWALHCQGKGGILGDDMGLGKTMQVNKLVLFY